MRKMELGRSSCATPATDSGMTHSCLGNGVYHLAMCDPEGAAGMMDGRLETVTKGHVTDRILLVEQTVKEEYSMPRSSKLNGNFSKSSGPNSLCQARSACITAVCATSGHGGGGPGCSGPAIANV